MGDVGVMGNGGAIGRCQGDTGNGWTNLDATGSTADEELATGRSSCGPDSETERLMTRGFRCPKTDIARIEPHILPAGASACQSA